MTLQDVFVIVTEFFTAIWTMDLVDIVIVFMVITGVIVVVKFLNFMDRISGNRGT